MQNRELLTLAEVTELLQEASGRDWPSRKTVERWLRNRTLEYVRVPFGKRYDRMVLLESALEVAHAIQKGIIQPGGNWLPKKGTE